MLISALLRAGNLGIDLAKGRAKANVRHIARQAAVGAAVGLFLILAFSFGLAAFTVWLAAEIGVVPALGFIGLGFLVIAALVLALAAATDKRRRRVAPQPIATAMKQEFAAVEAEPPPPGSAVGAMGVVALMAFLFARQVLRR